jgi:hypothetical protein
MFVVALKRSFHQIRALKRNYEPMTSTTFTKKFEPLHKK